MKASWLVLARRGKPFSNLGNVMRATAAKSSLWYN